MCDIIDKAFSLALTTFPTFEMLPYTPVKSFSSPSTITFILRSSNFFIPSLLKRVDVITTSGFNSTIFSIFGEASFQ